METLEVLYDYDTDEFDVVQVLKTAGNFQLHGLDFCTEVHRYLG